MTRTLARDAALTWAGAMCGWSLGATWPPLLALAFVVVVAVGLPVVVHRLEGRL